MIPYVISVTITMSLVWKFSLTRTFQSSPAELFHDDCPTKLTNVLLIKNGKDKNTYSFRAYFIFSSYIQTFDNITLNSHHYFSPEPVCIGFWLSIVCEPCPEHYKIYSYDFLKNLTPLIHLINKYWMSAVFKKCQSLNSVRSKYISQLIFV